MAKTSNPFTNDSLDIDDAPQFIAEAPASSIPSITVSVTVSKKFGGELFTETHGETVEFERPVTQGAADAARKDVREKLISQTLAYVEQRVAEHKAVQAELKASNPGYTSVHEQAPVAAQAAPVQAAVAGGGLSSIQGAANGAPISGGWLTYDEGKRYLSEAAFSRAAFEVDALTQCASYGLSEQDIKVWDNRSSIKGHNIGRVVVKEGATHPLALALGVGRAVAWITENNIDGSLKLQATKEFNAAKEKELIRQEVAAQMAAEAAAKAGQA